MKKTKIICSIGPATNTADVMEQLVLNGMNVARINFSHATIEERQQVIDTVKEVRERTGQNIGLLYDTKGPEFRNGMLENGEITLVEGKTIRIVKEEVLGNEERFSVNHPKALESLKPGSIILLENGLMKIEIEETDAEGVTGRIINGGVLGNKKSLSAPGVKLDIPFISEDDKFDIEYACKNEGDFLALSFVSTKEDVLAAREILKANNREDLKIISKVESVTGVENLDEIIEVSDGIMVARGDLGVEVPMQELPMVQKMMVERCRAKGVICVVATEMLESMKKNARPTRAEVSDVANAVLDGTDAVMLSGETTIGKFPVETVRYMAEVCESTEARVDFVGMFESELEVDMTTTIANSVTVADQLLGSKAICAATMSGYTARVISNYKPNSVIMAATPSEEVARSLALNWGVYPKVVPMYGNTDEIVKATSELAKNTFNLESGDLVVVTGGFPNTETKKVTNFMKLEEV